jgi:uncharacterized protein
VKNFFQPVFDLEAYRVGKDRKMIKINDYKQRIQSICRDLSLQRLDLVGSAAREDFSEASDIDVLIRFEGDESLFDRYFELKERLEEIFERPVDVIEERAVVNPFFKQAIEKDRIRIYGT